MTENRRARNLEILKGDTNEKLIERYAWYVQNFNPTDDDRCDDYEMVKAEVLRRMRGEV